MRTLNTGTLFLLLFFSCWSCTKKQPVDDNPSGGGGMCYPVAVVEDYPNCRDSTVLEYANGILSTAVFHSNCGGLNIKQGQRFILETGRIYRIDTTTLLDRDTFFVDGAFRLLEFHPSRTSGDALTRFFYSSEGVPQNSVVYYNGVPTDTTHYTYINGDMVAWHDSRYDTKCTYYDTLVPVTGLFTQQSLKWGSARYPQSRHLLKSFSQNGTQPFEFAYEFDASRNVTKVKMTMPITGTVYTTRYLYACAVE